MKHELLYETQAQFTAAQGNSGNVTSITPGVAYIEESDESKFNKPYDTLTIVYKVDDISSPTKIYNSESVKTNLKEIFVDKIETPVSSLTTTYQFENVGLHTIIYRYSNLSTIPTSAFTDCTTVYGVSLPKSVTGANGLNHNYCFARCTNLSKFVINGEPVNIGQYFFENCTSLEELHLPKSINTFYNPTFKGCVNMKRVYVDDLESYMNINQPYTMGRSFPLDNSTAGGSIYVNGEELVDLVVPDSITGISAACFMNCKSIKTINFNKTKAIGSSAFKNCKNLFAVNNYDDITIISRNSFENCISLQTFELDNINRIENSAFSGCSSLANVGETSAITVIGEYAFNACSSLHTFNFDSLTSIGQFAFENSGLLGDVIIPETTLSVTGSTFNNTNITNFTMLSTGGTFTTRSNRTSFGNNNGTFTVYGNLRRVGATGLRFKNIVVKNNYTVNSGLYFLTTSPQFNSFKINGDFVGKNDSNGLVHTYSNGESQLKFVEIIGQCSGRMLYNSAVPATAIGSGAIFHLAYSAKVTASLTDIFSDNHTNPRTNGGNIGRVLKIYVGDGSSEEHDQAILDQYLADDAWSAYASKLDLWYNYHGEYREE